MSLTDRQRQIYDWVVAYQALHYCSPTYAEIADAHFIAWQVAQQHMQAIVRRGYLKPVATAKGEHRGWRVVPVD